jgi:hypothetical protein
MVLIACVSNVRLKKGLYMKRLSDIDVLLLVVVCICMSIAIACRVKVSWEVNSRNSMERSMIQVFSNGNL